MRFLFRLALAVDMKMRKNRFLVKLFDGIILIPIVVASDRP